MHVGAFLYLFQYIWLTVIIMHALSIDKSMRYGELRLDIFGLDHDFIPMSDLSLQL
jgi:hypothetical protein